MITEINSIPPVEKVTINNLKSTGAGNSGSIVASEQKAVESNTDSTTTVNSSTNKKQTENKTVSTKNSNTPDYSALASKIKESLNDNKLDVEFKYNKNSNQMLVQIIDPKTKEVLQQFPPEIAIQLTKMVSKSIDTGSLANAKV